MQGEKKFQSKTQKIKKNKVKEIPYNDTVDTFDHFGQFNWLAKPQPHNLAENTATQTRLTAQRPHV